ncbi:class C sortase [uncultured Vagococcus sp.]|uniref:sortase family protein n=1 Tax=uncultured Vagococcus sp. TaxID=189676 RepID=UPI00258985C8|nr:class C sortase [uncultured Vagococcus sp.]
MKKKKTSSKLKYFAIFMIISGILTLLYPIFANYLANQERSRAVSNYSNKMSEVSESEKQAQLENAYEYNDYIFNKQQHKEVLKVDYKKILRLNEVMGTLDIPAIGIKKMPFYQGTDYQTLNKGLGHFESTSIPVGGENTRSVITGHSGVQNQVLFTDVLALKEGDVFFINILGEKLAYQIYSMEEVLPNQVDKINVEPGKDIVTLLTCTPPGINTFRLLVNGKRIDYKEASELPVVKRNNFNYTNVVLISLGINALIFIILYGIYRRFLKESQSKNKKKARRAKKKIKSLIKVTKALFIILFVVMNFVLATALYGYFKMQEEPQIETISLGENLELSHYNLSKSEQGVFDDKEIASVKISNYAEAKTKTLETINNYGIGKIIIPNANIDLPILAGMSNENLLTGASTYRENQLLGDGNYVLLTHNIFEKDVLFHRIIHLKQGDLIYTTDFKDVYVYEVFLNKKIKETEVNYVKEQEGETILTLLRCEGDIGTIYRRVVQGKLKEKTSLSDSEMKRLNLEKKSLRDEGILIEKEPLNNLEKTSIKLASKVVSEPLQMIIPIFFLFIMPIIFFGLI